MTGTRRPGRPMGELAVSALTWSRETRLDVTHLDIAHALQMPRETASKVLFNLRASGHMVEVGEIQQAGARRPVKVCAPAEPAAGAERSFWEQPVPQLLVLDWPRFG